MHETDTSSVGNFLPGFLDRFGPAGFKLESFRGDFTVVVSKDQLRDVLGFLKDRLGFKMLMDIVGLDYLKYSLPQPERFAVVYQLFSLERSARIRVKVFVNEEVCEIPSVHDLFAAANWFEREVWDLFGIVFRGHPNLVRILCHQEFVGHPLRKDYPSDQFQALKTAVESKEL